MAEKGFNLAIAIKDQLTPCIALGSQPDDPQPEDDIAEYLVRIENCSKNIQTTSLTADLPYGTTDPPLKLDTPYDQRKNSIENKTLRFGVASTMEEKYYPFSVKGSAWLYIKLRKTRVEIMWLHNGIGSSTTILTGANVIDIVPSKYSIYGRIHV